MSNNDGCCISRSCEFKALNIPMEVKSGLNVRARSLKVYREKYSPQLAVRCSMQNLRIDDGLPNLPLWLLPFGWKFLTGM